MTEKPLSSGGVDVERGHTFDGITEFDNKLPNWWLWSFYLACIYSVVYWIAYHSTGFADHPGEQYELRIEAAEAAAEAEQLLEVVDDDGLRGLAEDPAVVAKGAKVFAGTCAACHTPTGAGLIGPNLTDKFWLHGGSPTAIYKIVTEGAPDPTKGMLPWRPQIGEAQCQQVTAFLLTLRNTNVAGGKAAEGEPYDGQ